MNILQIINGNTNELENEQLKLRLKQFGLCPKDWNIRLLRANQYIIENKNDSNFYFTGHTSTKGFQKNWIRIALKNI